MKTKEENEKSIRCVDCKNYPNMCGYYDQDRYRKHTCPYVDERQQGFKPAEEMSLKDTIHQYKCWLHGTAKNTELLDMVHYYLKEYQKKTNVL